MKFLVTSKAGAYRSFYKITFSYISMERISKKLSREIIIGMVLFILFLVGLWFGYIKGISHTSGIIEFNLTLKIITTIFLILIFYFAYWLYSKKRSNAKSPMTYSYK